MLGIRARAVRDRGREAEQAALSDVDVFACSEHVADHRVRDANTREFRARPGVEHADVLVRPRDEHHAACDGRRTHGMGHAAHERAHAAFIDEDLAVAAAFARAERESDSVAFATSAREVRTTGAARCRLAKQRLAIDERQSDDLLFGLDHDDVARDDRDRDRRDRLSEE